MRSTSAMFTQFRGWRY